ncbi:nicotinamide-nucleotide adenylyltransferase [Halobacteriales archaeon SW_7_68_16]|nr:MAG: nicotinamide-nucleotide adenylyltransferase [Halobacteriales archaeon SW_7_68_16]
MRRGFYVGRFQPYHDGHHWMVERILDEVDELVVAVGSADASHTPRNPFSAGERVTMIQRTLAAYEQVTYTVPIEDIDRNAVWVGHVRSMVPRFDVAYSNNPLVARLFEEAGVEVRGMAMHERDRLEGATVRDRMRDGGDWRALVPEAVAGVIDEIDGVERLRAIHGTDGGVRETTDAGDGAEP